MNRTIGVFAMLSMAAMGVSGCDGETRTESSPRSPVVYNGVSYERANLELVFDSTGERVGGAWTSGGGYEGDVVKVNGEWHECHGDCVNAIRRALAESQRGDSGSDSGHSD